jgi:hypothetical protein
MALPENISSLTSSSLTNITKNKLSSKVDKTKTTILSRTDKISKRILDLEKRITDLNEEYNIKFKELDARSKKPPLPTQEEKQKNFADIQNKKDEELLFLKNEIEQLKKDITNVQVDNPLKEFKIKLEGFKSKKENRKKRSKEEQNKANKDRIKSVLGNAKKTIAGTISVLLTNQIISLVSNDAKLQELVDKTNEVIDAADTQEKLNQARVLRNSALNILNIQERKVKLIQNIIKTLDAIIRIISTLIRILSLIPIPPFAPPKISVTLIQAINLLDSLSTITALINPILQGIIDNLKRLKSELKQLGDLLGNQSLNGLEGDALKLAILSLKNPIGINGGNNSNNINNNFEEYKGFRFELRTEENLGAHRAVVVNNIKRKFAVAINKDGVVVVQSDYSFTQDPNDLIDQIKLIIDQRNLQA